VSPRDIFAVGSSRLFVGGKEIDEYHVYHYDGSLASPMNMSITAPILDLWASSGDNVVAVGRGGMIQRYNGTSWQAMESGSTKDIYAIWGLPSGELFAALQNSVLYYDGASWTELLTSSTTLTDIWGSSRDDIYIAQEGDALLHYDGQTWTLTQGWGRMVWGSASNDVYAASSDNRISHFDGQSWQSTSLPITHFMIDDLGGSRANVFVVGKGDDERLGPNIFHSDGTTWSHESIEFLLPFNRSLSAISGNDQELYVGGNFQTLMHHDGSSWRKYGLGTSGEVSDIWIGPGNSLFTVGDYGSIAMLFDGTEWTKYSPPGELVHVWGNELNDVFFVGSDGQIAHFDGSTFRSMVSSTTVHLYDVWGRSGTEVYAVGSNETIITYDGESWRPMESNTTEDLRAIWGDSEFAVAVGGGGAILHLSNGRWIPMNSPSAETLTGVWGASSSDIYAVGAHVVLHHDVSRWEILNDTLGGRAVWGRSSDDVYVLEPSRILRYGPSSTSSR